MGSISLAVGREVALMGLGSTLDRATAVLLCDGLDALEQANELAALLNPDGNCVALAATDTVPDERLLEKDLLVCSTSSPEGLERIKTFLRRAAPFVSGVWVPQVDDLLLWARERAVSEVRRVFMNGAALTTPDSLHRFLNHWKTAAPAKATTPAPVGAALVTRCLSDIEAKPIHWLWPARIARGKVTLIAGNPGLGKSQVTANIAATVSTGGYWPIDCSRCDGGSVLFLSAEDDPSDTLRPRLEAAGANLARVHIVDPIVRCGGKGNRTFSLELDLEELSKELQRLGDVAVVFVDPVTAYLGGIDSHKNAEVRSILAGLGELASKHDIAVVAVSHLNKATGTSDALMRVSGSLAFVAAARAAFLVAPDPDTPERRLFLPMKNNIGPDSSGLAFRIESATVDSPSGSLPTSRIVWDGEPVNLRADDILGSSSNESGGSAIREAEEFLRQSLTKPMPSIELFREAKAIGVADKTLRRAADNLGVLKNKSGMRGGWTWSLPPKMAKEDEDARQNNVTTFERVDHLREPNTDLREVEL